MPKLPLTLPQSGRPHKNSRVPVVLNGFHFVTMQPAVNSGIISNKEISHLIVAPEVSYHGTMVESTLLVVATHSLTNVCSSLHA